MCRRRPADRWNFKVSSRAPILEAPRGFALVEALAALAITALLAALLLPILANSLSRWSATVARAGRLDQLMRAEVSLQAELASLAALPDPAAPSSSRGPGRPFFRGEARALVFARLTAEEPGAPTLSAVSLGIEADETGEALVRRSGAPRGLGPGVDPARLGSPIAVLTGEKAMHFAYLDSEGTPSESWTDRPDLPAAIALTVVSADGREHVLSFTTPVRRPVARPGRERRQGR